MHGCRLLFLTLVVALLTVVSPSEGGRTPRSNTNGGGTLTDTPVFRATRRDPEIFVNLKVPEERERWFVLKYRKATQTRWVNIEYGSDRSELQSSTSNEQ